MKKQGSIFIIYKIDLFHLTLLLFYRHCKFLINENKKTSIVKVSNCDLNTSILLHMTYTFRTYSIYLIVSVYCCSIFLPYVVHAQTWADVSQETNQKQINYLQEKANQTISFPDTDISSTNDITQIVSLFVDSDIYDNISDDIERYATKYIQQKLPRTKVLVIPLNKNIKPENIALINDNLYHDGIKGKSSRLVGTIVI